ncbi:MAG TPA: hypothetical protein VKE22_00560 [Haliangiales bacterium]|nr:hypothetical protein [Haliangiales bacterium]
MRSKASNFLVVALLAGACGGGTQKPATTPLRPNATPVTPAVAPQTPVAGPADCPPIEPNKGLPPKTLKELSMSEAEAYATQGLKTQIESEKIGLAPADARALLKQAMDKYFTALAADPYNVKATYNLGAAYGRIGRCQCANNLLARLVEMQSWPSSKVDIEDCANRIFGKGKKWKDRPDPDFDRCRTEERFRSIVSKF